MEIFSIVMSKESFSNPPVVDVIGSHRHFICAKNHLVEKIIDMAQRDSAFAFALWNDENHDDFRPAIGYMRPEKECENFFLRDEDVLEFPEDVKTAMRDYLVGDIWDAYYVYCSTAEVRDATYRFNIEKNELEDD